MTNNRLHPDEAEALAKLRQWHAYKSPENYRRMERAARDHVRAEHEREDQHTGEAA